MRLILLKDDLSTTIYPVHQLLKFVAVKGSRGMGMLRFQGDSQYYYLSPQAALDLCNWLQADRSEIQIVFKLNNGQFEKV